MDVGRYFESITLELESLKNRVRQFIEDRHWQTDGEWKESVLRSILVRHVPQHVGVGRGFVVEQEGCSSQIDVLLYDRRKPVLYRDGDLVFVTSDCVVGIIEVKSRLTSVGLTSSTQLLARNSELIKRNQRRIEVNRASVGFSFSGRQPAQRPLNPASRRGLFVGLFSYESALGRDPLPRVLDALHAAAGGRENSLVTHACCDSDSFIRYWQRSPDGEIRNYNSWRAYSVPNRAPAYFIYNAVSFVSGLTVLANEDAWFPIEGKEACFMRDLALAGPSSR